MTVVNRYRCLQCGRSAYVYSTPVKGYENLGFYFPPQAPCCPCVDLAEMTLEETTARVDWKAAT